MGTYIHATRLLMLTRCGIPQLLNEYSDHEVHLYEADSRPGGHANTVRYRPPGDKGESIDVDT